VVNARGKVVDGLKWQNGQLVDRPWTEHPTFRESVRRQNALQRAEDQFHARRGPSFNEAGYAPPDPQAPDYREVKAVGGVITTSIKRRLSKAERENRGKLLKLATGIKDAVMRGDRAAAGAMLRGAKAAAFTPRIYQAHPRWRLSLPEFPVGLPKCPSSPQKISRFDFTGNFGQNPWNMALLTAAKNR
jgi:hypothetical protein